MKKSKKILLFIVMFLILALLAGFLVLKFYILPQTGNLLHSLLQDEEIQSVLEQHTPDELGDSLNQQESSVSAPDQTEVVLPPLPPNFQTPAPKSTPAPKNKIEYVKSQIPAADFSAGMALVSKVNVGYISGLLSGGLTPEEKRELKSYITSRLSSGEISKALELYNKYSYLL